MAFFCSSAEQEQLVLFLLLSLFPIVSVYRLPRRYRRLLRRRARPAARYLAVAPACPTVVIYLLTVTVAAHGRHRLRAGRAARGARPTPRQRANALVQPGHVRFVLGLHQDAAQDADAVGVHLDVRVAAAKASASIRSVERKTGSSARHARVEHALARGVDLRGARAAREVGDDVELRARCAGAARRSRAAAPPRRGRRARRRRGSARGRASAASATAPPRPRRRGSTRARSRPGAGRRT